MHRSPLWRDSRYLWQPRLRQSSLSPPCCTPDSGPLRPFHRPGFIVCGDRGGCSPFGGGGCIHKFTATVTARKREGAGAGRGRNLRDRFLSPADTQTHGHWCVSLTGPTRWVKWRCRLKLGNGTPAIL
ncbi:hypothetical protein DPEC_G00268810 [Dallia pectoralis]|uniref:Uncharacterized protein n=1 Tax=Dallia pectoralis TaxID=75939 RepID=A0ACC2FNZ9_DALPE|nr:hypothetical protein DPEC_G00268810 [Dallia pectoralis]